MKDFSFPGKNVKNYDLRKIRCDGEKRVFRLTLTLYVSVVWLPVIDAVFALAYRRAVRYTDVNTPLQSTCLRSLQEIDSCSSSRAYVVCR